MFNEFVLLLDDACKTATPLTKWCN